MAALGTSLLGLGIRLVGDLDRTQALASMAALWTLILAIDFVISFSYTLFPRAAKQREAGSHPASHRRRSVRARAGRP